MPICSVLVRNANQESKSTSRSFVDDDYDLWKAAEPLTQNDVIIVRYFYKAKGFVIFKNVLLTRKALNRM